jgi:hypothetical protein
MGVMVMDAGAAGGFNATAVNLAEVFALYPQELNVLTLIESVENAAALDKNFILIILELFISPESIDTPVIPPKPEGIVQVYPTAPDVIAAVYLYTRA